MGFLDPFEHPDHLDNKGEGQRCAYKQDKTGGKKCHDKTERVIKAIGCPEQINAEKQEKKRYKRQHNLKNPPSIFHEIL